MKESLKKNGKGIILMMISAFSLSVGQLLWKMADLGSMMQDAGSLSGMIAIFLKILPGFVIYAIGALVMTIALGYGELSVLQPVNSMSYVFALILSSIFLTEPITPLMVVGIVIIIVGVILMGGSSK
ncbi:MAG: EamA family transporter [Lachnospiraceae bacterium]|nr:EamA family transporter [Lachnospiraceae bacterium]